MVGDAGHEHEDAERNECRAEVARGLGARKHLALMQLLEDLKDGEAETDQGSAVRITDINVRSALMRVRWKDMPVRRIDISVRFVESAVR